LLHSNRVTPAYRQITYHIGPPTVCVITLGVKLADDVRLCWTNAMFDSIERHVILQLHQSLYSGLSHDSVISCTHNTVSRCQMLYNGVDTARQVISSSAHSWLICRVNQSHRCLLINDRANQ